MIHLHVGRMWATIGPLEIGHPLHSALANVLSYQATSHAGEYVHLLEHYEGQTWRFPAGLVPRVGATIANSGYAIHKTHDEHEVIREPFATRRFQLRPYQAAAVAAVFKGPRPGGVLRAATGAGKTAMAAKMIQLGCTRTLFIVHTKDLMRQAQEMFTNLLGIEAGQIGDGEDDIREVTVATIQTLARGRHDDYLATVQMAIFDECHHVAAPTLYTVRCKMEQAPIVIGLSASPWRDDGHDMLIEAACGPVKYNITASDLIDLGFLVRPDIHVFRRDIPQSLRTLRATAPGQYARAYRDIVTDNEVRNRFVAKLATEQLRQGRRVLVLVRYIDHGQTLASLIPGAIFVEGNDSAEARAAAFDGFRTGEIACLIGTSLCDEGVDIPAADSLILAGAGASSTRALQRIGRVIRPAPGKATAYVADIVDDHPTFKRQWYARNKVYKTERLFTTREIHIPLDSR